MSGDFIDSNVLLYLFSGDQEQRREIAQRVVDEALAQNDSAISFQVVQEVLNGVVRHTATPITQEDIQVFLRNTLGRLWRVMPSEHLYQDAMRIHFRYQYSFYDALIIAAALDAGCDRLLSEDLQAGQRIEGLTIVNPFAGTATR